MVSFTRVGRTNVHVYGAWDLSCRRIPLDRISQVSHLFLVLRLCCREASPNYLRIKLLSQLCLKRRLAPPCPADAVLGWTIQYTKDRATGGSVISRLRRLDYTRRMLVYIGAAMVVQASEHARRSFKRD